MTHQNRLEQSQNAKQALIDKMAFSKKMKKHKQLFKQWCDEREMLEDNQSLSDYFSDWTEYERDIKDKIPSCWVDISSPNDELPSYSVWGEWQNEADNLILWIDSHDPLVREENNINRAFKRFSLDMRLKDNLDGGHNFIFESDDFNKILGYLGQL
jgi:hypothetical protein